jgi:hypothetical protein
MTLRSVVVLLLALGVALAQTGCGHGCDEIGCQPGVSVDLGTVFEEPGTYRVTVIADGDTTVCTLTLPRTEGEDCDSEAAWTSGRGEATTSGSGDQSQGPARNLTGVTVIGEPATIDVTVERNDQEVLSDTVTPEYREVEINGEGCGTCREGSALVEID